MQTQEERANREAGLCVTRRFEGLIESAAWVKCNRKGSLLVVGLLVAVLIATGLFGKRKQ